MQITLNNDEVMEALRKALEEKIISFTGEIDINQCFFKVTAGEKEVDDLEEVEFIAIYNDLANQQAEGL